MKLLYGKPDLSILIMEEASVLCRSTGTGESFNGEGDFEGIGDWE